MDDMNLGELLVEKTEETRPVRFLKFSKVAKTSRRPRKKLKPCSTSKQGSPMKNKGR